MHILVKLIFFNESIFGLLDRCREWVKEFDQIEIVSVAGRDLVAMSILTVFSHSDTKF